MNSEHLYSTDCELSAGQEEICLFLRTAIGTLEETIAEYYEPRMMEALDLRNEDFLHLERRKRLVRALIDHIGSIDDQREMLFPYYPDIDVELADQYVEEACLRRWYVETLRWWKVQFSLCGNDGNNDNELSQEEEIAMTIEDLLIRHDPTYDSMQSAAHAALIYASLHAKYSTLYRRIITSTVGRFSLGQAPSFVLLLSDSSQMLLLLQSWISNVLLLRQIHHFHLLHKQIVARTMDECRAIIKEHIVKHRGDIQSYLRLGGFNGYVEEVLS